MKFGMNTGCLHNLSLEQLATWAASIGMETFEIPAGPGDKLCDVDKILHGGAPALKKPIEAKGITISSLIYATNHLDPNAAQRKKGNTNMLKVIEAAEQLEVQFVGCFVGGDLTQNFFGNMGLVEEHFLPLVAHAKDHGVKLCIENCPAGGWNIGNNPAVWRELFEATAGEGLDGYLLLEYDPSHLIWLQVDYLKAAAEFAPKIGIMHAKDTVINKIALSDNGILGLKDSWWKYKIPGLGNVDWKALLGSLKQNGFDGAVNIEHEDPEYSGTDEKCKDGLIKGLRTLREAAP